MRGSEKKKLINENEKFLFSPLYQREQGHRLHFINVLHLPRFCVRCNTKGRCVIEEVTEKRASKFLSSGVIPVHVILGKRCSVVDVFVVSLKLPLM